jgi:hypothetical protein
MKRRIFQRKSNGVLKNETQHYYELRIAELEKQYADLVDQPYSAGKLSEIVSELGKLWNEKLKSEENERLAGANGAKSLQQIQEEVQEIINNARYQITSAKDREAKRRVFQQGLRKVITILDEWEIAD